MSRHEFAGTYSGGVSDCIVCDAVLAHVMHDLVVDAIRALHILDDIFNGSQPQYAQIAAVTRSLKSSIDAAGCPQRDAWGPSI